MALAGAAAKEEANLADFFSVVAVLLTKIACANDIK